MLARSLLRQSVLLASADIGIGRVDIITQVRFRRRVLAPPYGTLPKYEAIRVAVPIHDRDWIETALQSERGPVERSLYKRVLPSTEQLPDNSKAVYSPENSKRIGLIGRKIGMTYQWLNDGTRILCTLIHIPDNHVLQAFDPQTWYKRSLSGKRKAFSVYGPMWNVLVGAKDANSIFYTDAYRRIFTRVGVPVKELLAGFVCTEDAVVAPGTKLDIRHFNIGQFVDVSGKTIDYGFQGAMVRWGFKGQPKLRTTKSHRRLGSTGAKGDSRVWPGKRMHGHMGYEWQHARGLEIIRINPIKQVLYVKGCVPGDIDETLLIKDSFCEKKHVVDPPFPTYIAAEPAIAEEGDESAAELHEIHNVTSQDLYTLKLFRFSQPSVVFTEADETKLTARDKSKAKLAKVKK